MDGFCQLFLVSQAAISNTRDKVKHNDCSTMFLELIYTIHLITVLEVILMGRLEINNYFHMTSLLNNS